MRYDIPMTYRKGGPIRARLDAFAVTSDNDLMTLPESAGTGSRSLPVSAPTGEFDIRCPAFLRGLACVIEARTQIGDMP